MNDEQIYDFFAGIRQINERFGRTANALEAIDDKICETNDKIEELECIDRKLCAIWTQLERIANALENHGTLTLKVENSFVPSDDDDEEEEEDDGWAITNENGRVVDEGE